MYIVFMQHTRGVLCNIKLEIVDILYVYINIYTYTHTYIVYIAVYVYRFCFSLV